MPPSFLLRRIIKYGKLWKEEDWDSSATRKNLKVHVRSNPHDSSTLGKASFKKICFWLQNTQIYIVTLYRIIRIIAFTKYIFWLDDLLGAIFFRVLNIIVRFFLAYMSMRFFLLDAIEGRGFFNVQFYTKFAVLNQFVQL